MTAKMQHDPHANFENYWTMSTVALATRVLAFVTIKIMAVAAAAAVQAPEFAIMILALQASIVISSADIPCLILETSAKDPKPEHQINSKPHCL